MPSQYRWRSPQNVSMTGFSEWSTGGIVGRLAGSRRRASSGPQLTSDSSLSTPRSQSETSESQDHRGSCERESKVAKKSESLPRSPKKSARYQGCPRLPKVAQGCQDCQVAILDQTQ